MSGQGAEAIRRACERLVLDSLAHEDAADWRALGRLFTGDAVLIRPDGRTLDGRAAIVESYEATPVDRLTRHACTNIRVDMTGRQTACGTALVLVFVADPVEEAGDPRTSPGPVVGEFVDRFRLTPQGWRITRREASITLRPTGQPGP